MCVASHILQTSSSSVTVRLPDEHKDSLRILTHIHRSRIVNEQHGVLAQEYTLSPLRPN